MTFLVFACACGDAARRFVPGVRQCGIVCRAGVRPWRKAGRGVKPAKVSLPSAAVPSVGVTGNFSTCRRGRSGGGLKALQCGALLTAEPCGVFWPLRAAGAGAGRFVRQGRALRALRGPQVCQAGQAGRAKSSCAGLSFQTYSMARAMSRAGASPYVSRMKPRHMSMPAETPEEV